VRLRIRKQRLAALAATAGLIIAPSLAVTAAQASSQVLPTLVSAVPGANTPNIANGTTLAITQVGSKVIVGGSFTSVSPPGTTSGAVTRNYIFAFDSTTGAIDTSFVPQIDGQVEGLSPGLSPNTVYVAGYFSHVNGVKAKSFALLDTTTGLMVPGFQPASVDGSGWAVRPYAGHLIIAGAFKNVGGVIHQGLASLDPATGALDPYVNVQLTGHHNFNGTGSNGSLGGRRMDISPPLPDGTSRLIVVGNFKMADGVVHDQIVMVDLGASSATTDPSWNTSGFSAACASASYDSYTRDVSFSPDGSYFAVATTGGSTFSKNIDGTRSLCDTVTRWTAANTGTDVQPDWVDWTGNDSFESIAVTGNAIYAGGHQRWVNNSFCSDCPGAGAVPRPGIVAVNPLNGLPYLWNPGRNPRGAGAYALWITPNGLYVGSDTTFIGNHKYYRGRIAFFPLAGGEDVTIAPPEQLPSNVYLVSSSAQTNTLTDRFYDGTTVGPTNTVPNPDSIAWSQVRGAFMIGDTLFYGYSDGMFYRRSFDGAALGAASLADPYHDPLWDTVDTGSGQTYTGAFPNLYGSEMKTVTGMIYINGRLYYSLSGQHQLRYRYFTPDGGVIGSDEFTAGGTIDFSHISGMFLSGNALYYANSTDGNLHSASFGNGAPDVSTDTVVSGPGIDGNDWHTDGMFLHP